MKSSKSIEFITLRKFYPKTTLPMAGESDPTLFRSIPDTYKWAGVFIERVASCFGRRWVSDRLSQWRWRMSTAFTGVGCAESVLTPDHA